MNPWAKLKARKTGGPRRLPRLGTRPRPAPIAAGLPATQASRSARRSADRLLPLPAPPRPRGWRAGLGVKSPSRHPTSEPPGPSQRGAERKPFPGPGTRDPVATKHSRPDGRRPPARPPDRASPRRLFLPSPIARRAAGAAGATARGRATGALFVALRGRRRAAGCGRGARSLAEAEARQRPGDGGGGAGKGRGGALGEEREGRAWRGRGPRGGEGDGRESRTGAGPGEGGGPREGEGKGRERDGGEGGVLRGRGGGGALGEEREGR